MQTKETDFEIYRKNICMNCINKNNELDLCNVIRTRIKYEKENINLIKCINYKKG